MVGVVIVSDFCISESEIYGNYINYIERKDAVRNENVDKFNLYHEYMGNPQKSSGLFTDSKDFLSMEEKEELKEAFQNAQECGSLMWQTVVSFDNRWLEINGLFDPQSGYLNEKRIKDATRKGIREMLKKEGMENALYSAAIHFNTDNIHVHYAIVDPLLERKKKEFITPEGNKKEEYVGKMKVKSFESAKSIIANDLDISQDQNQKINMIIREHMLWRIKNNPLISSPDFRDDIIKIYNQLPEDRKKWKYNMNAIEQVRPELDKVTEKYIEKYHAAEFKELQKLLLYQQERYQMAYGGEENHFAANKIKDLYSRLGNAILRELKSFDDEILKEENIKLKNKNEDDLLKSDYIENLVDNRKILEEKSFEVKENKITDKDEDICSQVFQGRYYIKWTERYKKAKNMLCEEMDEQNLIRIREAFSEEAKSGNVLAIYEMGKLYETGKDEKNEINLEMAKQYYEEAFKGFSFLNEKVENENLSRETSYISGYIKYRIGKMYYYGKGVGKDYEKAFLMIKEAVSLGNKIAYYDLGNMYYDGTGTVQDYGEAMLCYKQSSNPYAKYKLGKMYKQGIGTKQNVKEAEICFKEAYDLFLKCEKEKTIDDNMQYRMGYMLYNGIGVEKDIEKAIKYLKASASKGNIYGQVLLAEIYYEIGDMEKVNLALKMLENAADQGNVNAQYSIGKKYIDLREWELAKRYLTQSADQGNEYAQYTIGKLYVEGQAIGKDVKLGMKYLLQSADQNNNHALFYLGKMYYYGNDVKKNMKIARGYLERAEDLGNMRASMLLHQNLYKCNHKKLSLNLEETLKKLKRSMKSEYEHFKNQIEYEHMIEKSSLEFDQ